jgi:predicted RNase H-like nuclease (RuvC/YqgF family)
MRRTILFLSVTTVCFIGVCLAGATDTVNRLNSKRKLPSLKELFSVKKSKQQIDKTSKEKKEESKQAKPVQQIQGDTLSLQNQILSLQNRVASLEAKANNLQTTSRQQIDAFEKKILNLQTKVNNLQNSTAATGEVIGFTKTAANKYTLSANGAKIEVDAVGNVTIKANVGMTVESGGQMNIKSSILRFNNGNKRVAHVGDPGSVHGNCIPGPLQDGTIIRGSPTVFVP